MKLTIHFDGGSRGNPGPASAGVVITDAETGRPVHEAGYFLGRCTNNVAEYTGLIRSLEVAKKMGAGEVDIFSDSQLLVRQILGEYRVKSPDLKPLYEKAVRLLDGFDAWHIEHVRRDGNQRADELANLAMDRQADVSGDGTPMPSDPAKHTGVERVVWTATLSGKNGRCLAGCATGNEYTFGPTTPEGFCLHATRAMLTDGPLDWPNNRRTGSVRCQACGLTVQMHVLHRE
ncbi:MAG: hypothetical protein Kow00105_04120 [Phycisphaeraceae bacterium]